MGGGGIRDVGIERQFRRDSQRNNLSICFMTKLVQSIIKCSHITKCAGGNILCDEFYLSSGTHWSLMI